MNTQPPVVWEKVLGHPGDLSITRDGELLIHDGAVSK